MWHGDYTATIEISSSPAADHEQVRAELEEEIRKIKLPKAGKHVLKVTVTFKAKPGP